MHVEVVQLQLIENPDMQLQLITERQQLIAMILLASLVRGDDSLVWGFDGGAGSGVGSANESHWYQWWRYDGFFCWVLWWYDLWKKTCRFIAIKYLEVKDGCGEVGIRMWSMKLKIRKRSGFNLTQNGRSSSLDRCGKGGGIIHTLWYTNLQRTGAELTNQQG